MSATIWSPQGQRIAPNLPVGAVKTYGIRAPLQTHWRPATCAEVECLAYQRGWRTTVDVRSELGARQAYYIRMHSGRSFEVSEVNELGMVTFTFPAGQKCFQEHRVPLERPQIFVVRGGDWRGNPRGEFRRHVRAADWVDDFAEHQDKLADRFTQG